MLVVVSSEPQLLPLLVVQFSEPHLLEGKQRRRPEVVSLGS